MLELIQAFLFTILIVVLSVNISRTRKGKVIAGNKNTLRLLLVVLIAVNM